MNANNKNSIIVLGTATTDFVNRFIKDHTLDCFENFNEENFLKLKNIFKQLSDGNQLTILLVFLGGRSSFNFIQSILKLDFPRLDEFVFPIYTKPFYWEGGKRKKNSGNF